MLAVIDNYDSFTYNIVQYLGELEADPRVFRNDEITIDELVALSPERILLSPGPGRPDNSGITLDVIDRFSGVVPILGVCLGHQSIGQHFGGSIIHASEIMHGKLSVIHHDEKGVFRGLGPRFVATRYHSLVIDKTRLPECLEMTSWTVTESGEIDEIMGVRHKLLDVEGVQFHPESISSQNGHDLFQNFLNRRGRV